MTMTACASWVVASSATVMGMCGHAVVPARRIPSVQFLKHTPLTGATPSTSAQRWDSDVDTHVPKQPPLCYWEKELVLADADRQIVTHPNQWLNDRLINAGQTLLRKQYGDRICGLQDVTKSRTLSMDIEPSEFV